MSVKCPECGKLYAKLSELNDVRQLGLSLKAACISCGTRFGVEMLWVKVAEIQLPEANVDEVSLQMTVKNAPKRWLKLVQGME